MRQKVTLTKTAKTQLKTQNSGGGGSYFFEVKLFMGGFEIEIGNLFVWPLSSRTAGRRSSAKVPKYGENSKEHTLPN